MRIVSGTHKGRIITPPKNLRARPTTDFAKENLFNVLGNMVDFEGLEVLDLFAGTGSISYEFASRGAGEITSVEINAVHQSFIRRTAQEFGFANIRAIKANAFLYVKNCSRKFDLVFSDAPYDLANADDIIELVFDCDIIKDGGLLVFEHSKDKDFSDNKYFSQLRSYGSVQFSFFKKV